MTVISWKYDGSNNNEMPLKEINERMNTLEKSLVNSMNSSDIFTHAYSRAGNNLKELIYYTSNQNDFMTELNMTLDKHEKYPIEINFYVDKEWKDLKALINDFKNK